MKYAFGLFLVFLGIIFLLEQVGFNIVGTFFALLGFWWPLLVIAGGVLALMRRHTVFGLLLLGLGIIWLVSNLFNIHAWNIVLPVAAILIGLKLLKPSKNSNDRVISEHSPAQMEEAVEELHDVGSIDEVVVLSSARRRIITNELKSGKISCILGSLELDLSQAKVTHDVSLQMQCVLAGIKVVVPKDVIVSLKGDSVIGHWDYIPPSRTIKKGVSTITFEGKTVLGEVEIIQR